MSFKQGLFQQQSLKLTMTQELSQAIALLQYSTQELTEFLESKALENPLIQVDPTAVPVNPLADRKKKRKATTTTIQNDWLEQIGEHKKSIVEHLMAQIPLNDEIKPLRQTLKLLIQCIDENGYLAECPACNNVPSDHLEKSIAILQAMEPAGIAARSLQECLSIQLKRMPTPHPLAIILVELHFEAFADKKWKELSKQLQVSLIDIQSAFDLIQTLNPRPGAKYMTESTAFVVPDIVVVWDGSEYSITVFDELLPKISFNQAYYHQYVSSDDKQVSRYMEDQAQQYQWLQKSLEQRKETLQKVALKIVEKQPDFFKSGPSNLRPMTMKEVADEIEIHESTVSRAVREKYVQTPFGIFELKSFFTSSIQTTNEDSTSSTQVKDALKKLIDNENKQKPLSDQEIVALLEDQEGIVVSRRTVAKYRDQLSIPSSSKRKRYDH
ncbi:RNA polymerase factor sigma-54 [Bacillus sp. CGMCC 1.16607]|uniref:RNA polymerase factor sigma-54 n=1 Tax=Bacillus sp. CGMCC 1.16607 TaxID=3351842 RepID=UPI003644996C